MISHYFFSNQIRTYLLQFTSIFYGLIVKTGKDECGETQDISVPIVIGNKDRVVASLLAGNTHNRQITLPTMSAHLSQIALAPERRKVQAYIDQRVTLPVGGIFPNDLTVVKRAMPVPYNVTIDLSIYASNLLQRDQILEQILVLFNPDLQLQKSDGPFDWTKLTKVELVSISNEENYPIGPDRRMIMWTLSFEMPIYISVPMGVRDDLVRRIIMRIGALDTMQVNEVDEDGDILPFREIFSTIDIHDKDPIGPIPPEPSQL